MRSLPFGHRNGSSSQLTPKRFSQPRLGAIAQQMTGGLASGFALIGWTGAVLGLSLALPPIVQAYTTEDVLTVSREVGEDYTALARRAEAAARATAQQRFDSDILLTRVIVTVLGQNGGQVAPILVLDVNRNDWRSRPDPQRWARYYRSTATLLDLDGASPNVRIAAPPVVPETTPQPAPIAPTTPADPAPPLSQPSRTVSPVVPANPNSGLTTPRIPPVPPVRPAQPLPSGINSPPSVNIPAAPTGR